MKALPVITATIALSLCLVSWQCGARKKTFSDKRIEVTGTILIQSDYCGGAEPSEDQLHPAPAPTAGVKLYIKRGTANNNISLLIDSVTSGENGAFSVKLVPGDYCLVEARKKGRYITPQNDQFHTYDTACYRKEYMECDYSLHLDANTGHVQLVLQHHCPWRTPCVSYYGPLPPAAQPHHQE